MEEEEDEDMVMDRLLSINWAEAPWPPLWKEPIEKSPQYEMGMIKRFTKRWAFEDRTDVNCNYHRTCMSFLQQVRKSRGYDLDVDALWFMKSPFGRVRTHCLDDDRFMEVLYPAVKFAVAEINTNAKPHGKCYEFLKVEKLVDAIYYRVRLITFTVKEVAPAKNVDVVETIQAMVYCQGGPKYRLIEWRFKPDVEST